LLDKVSAQLVTARFGWGFLAFHFAALIVFVSLLSLPIASHPLLLRRAGRILAGLLTAALGVFAFVPPRFCLRIIRATGLLWAYALAAGLAAAMLVKVSWSFWRPATYLTISLVRVVLSIFSSHVIADPTTATVGTQKFNVVVLKECSGLEGIGLMLVFSIGWLWLVRRECRFPAALLLIPAGLLCVWLLNIVRIAVLIFIGNAGAPNVAIGGFHSQAGWIAFNCVALGFAVATTRLPWVTLSPPERPRAATSAGNPAAAYLIPFLTILAAGMISQAAAGTFEWLYPLRFFAAVTALWVFRARYAQLDWRFGWLAPAAGVMVFAFWLAPDWFVSTHPDNGISAGLAPWPASAKMLWLAIRTAAAVVTVPIAEELAFRGFLIRRLISADFTSLDPKTYTWLSVLVSSAAFGLLHGERWLAGIFAGFLYAAVYLRRGRIGDAVVAHATTNALIAALVLWRGQWYLW